MVGEVGGAIDMGPPAKGTINVARKPCMEDDATYGRRRRWQQQLNFFLSPITFCSIRLSWFMLQSTTCGLCASSILVFTCVGICVNGSKDA